MNDNWQPNTEHLEHLHEQGVLAEVEQLLAEDASGIVRPSISYEEFIALLDDQGQNKP